MNKSVLVIGIICLLIGANVVTSTIGISNNDDTTPPVTWHILNPSEPDGENGWYIYVEIWVCAEDLESGVKEIKVRLYGGVWTTFSGQPCATFLFSEDGDDILIEYTATDNAGNQAPVKSFTIDIDRTNPSIDLIWEIVEGNPFEGWLLRFTATATDITSGMERVEFYLNEGLQDTVYGSGPEYRWEFRYYDDFSCEVTADAFDSAGNMASDIADGRGKATRNVLFWRLLERFPLLQRLLYIWKGDF